MDSESSTSDVPEKKPQTRRLSSSEDLEELMQIVGIKSKLALITAFALFFIIFVWSVLGSIPIKVTGNGISLTEQGPYIVSSQIQGMVTNVCVHPGESIEAGTLLVRMQNLTLALDSQLKEAEITRAENSLLLFTIQVETEDAARKNSILQQISAANLAVQSAQGKLPFLEKDLEAKQRLQQQGILAQRDVEEAKNALNQAKLDIKSNTAQIASLQAQYSQIYRQDEIDAKKKAIKALQADLSRLQLQDKFLNVYSDKSGKILELLVSAGDRVDPGSVITTLELPLGKGQHLQYIACFGAQHGESLDVNLKAEIQVSGVDSKEYGYLIGKIKYITPYPVTTQEIIGEVKNKEIAQFLLDDEKLVYLATISLELDQTTPSGYKWSTKQGPPWPLDAGTTGQVLAIVDEKPPILYILPEEVSPFFFRHLRPAP